MPAGRQKDLVKIINPTVVVSYKNLRSHHDLNLRDFQQQFPVTASASCKKNSSRKSPPAQISSSDQTALSSALTDINSSLQSSRASDSVQRHATPLPAI